MDISKFNKENIIRKIGEGIESVVYLYNDNGKVVALKRFKEDMDFLYSTSDNKEEKIIILKDEELLKNDIKILNKVYEEGKFVGFTSLYEPGKSISFLRRKKEKLKILKSIQERYEALNKKGIYIGDFNEDNFKITSTGIKLYDIDNFRVGSLDFNVANPIMIKYMKKCDNIDNIDYYCFNYFAISYLSDYVQEAVLNGIATPHFRGELRRKKVLKFIDHLENFSDRTIIEKNENGNQKTILDVLK